MLHRFGKFLTAIVIGLWITAQEGCSSNRAPQGGATGVVAVEVWRVLAPNELVGDPNNLGCRLSDDHINAFIAALQANATIFGQNAQLQWYGSIHPIADLELMTRTQNIDRWVMDDYLLWQSGFWNPDAINIYFVGNVQPGGNPNAIFAATLDPCATRPVGVPAFFCQ